MRILLDTNVIISAAMFPKSLIGEVIAHITKNHKLVICQFTLNELSNVFEKKLPERKKYLDEFIGKLKYELINMDITDFKKYPKIRDSNDMPILANAIEAKVDLLVTGDKDFDEIVIKNPIIMKPAKYIQEYMQLK